MTTIKPKITLSALLTLALVAMPAAAREMYRYVNNDGVKVVGYQVPPEFVANGYEVLSASGAVLEVIPRQLSEGELEGANAQQLEARRSAEEQERLQKWDESLLLRYSTIDDIEAARERALRDLRIRVSILKGKLRSLKQQVENYQAQAADQERLGFVVDEKHINAISDLRDEIGTTERAVSDRESEIALVDADFDKDVARFSTLLEIVELRRTMGAGG